MEPISISKFDVERNIRAPVIRSWQVLRHSYGSQYRVDILWLSKILNKHADRFVPYRQVAFTFRYLYAGSGYQASARTAVFVALQSLFNKMLFQILCLYVCLSVCLPVYQSIYPSICLSVCLCLSVRLSVPICIFVCLFICLFVTFVTTLYLTLGHVTFIQYRLFNVTVDAV
jgi:hypothetical protein